MDVWFFTEQSHFPAWDKYPGALRADIPGMYGDPEVSSRLLNEYLDEYVLADELGMNLLVNEHHIASTCMNPSVTLTLGVLARQTKRARLLGLGSIISNRPDPLRVAEEYAVVDSLSGGRLEMGMVKGAGWELLASNANPAGLMDRYWEAHDLIIEAMTRNDAQFSWEGEHFDYRAINLWPRCVQQPHPPVWIATSSPGGSVKRAAELNYRVATFMSGMKAKGVFDRYKQVYQDTWGTTPPPDKMGYMATCAVSRDKRETERLIKSMRDYVNSMKRIARAHLAPPGYAPPEDFAKLMANGGRMDTKQLLPNGDPMPADPTDDQMAEAGVMFWGEPERVYDQICAFNEAVGGFGHFLMMGQSAGMTFDQTRNSLIAFGEEVLPRLQKIDKFSIPTKASALEAFVD